MKNSLHLAWLYLRFNWLKTSVLIGAIALVLFIPLSLNSLVEQGAKSMMSRAENTPLVVGSKGSQTELGLSALYFKAPKIASMTYAEMERLQQENLAEAIPLHLRYFVKNQPIVGTSTAYFKFRELQFESGRMMTMLGECVLGSKAADALQATVGSFVISSPAGAFDIAGSYPLKMKVTGILNPSGTPDDAAVFVDIKTSWVISGRAHGHQDVGKDTADSLLLSRNGNTVVASPAVLSFTEITPDNIDSFHFHGNPETYPLDAIIALPKDRQSALVLRGRYENANGKVQMIVPEKVMEELLDTVVSVRNLVLLAAIAIGLATLIIAALVFTLSIRLRQGELHTMRRIGASRNAIAQIIGFEIVIILMLSVGIAIIMSLALEHYGVYLMESFIT